MSAVRVLQVTSMVRALRMMSWVVAMLMWVLQMVCRLVAPLVLSLRRVALGVLWAVVSSVVPMVRVTQAMHRVTVGPVCPGPTAEQTCGNLRSPRQTQQPATLLHPLQVLFFRQ